MRQSFLHKEEIQTSFRWLIDNDKDTEGMRVIADLHGGDLANPVAVAEFQEIKERVVFEVRDRVFHIAISDVYP